MRVIDASISVAFAIVILHTVVEEVDRVQATEEGKVADEANHVIFALTIVQVVLCAIIVICHVMNRTLFKAVKKAVQRDGGYSQDWKEVLGPNADKYWSDRAYRRRLLKRQFKVGHHAR